MRLYSDICLHLSVFIADRVHLLYPKQLSHYPLLRNASNSVFHEFVPVSMIDKAIHKGKKTAWHRRSCTFSRWRALVSERR